MKYQEIDFTQHNEIAIIKFNRPEVMNCICPQTHKELLAAWQEFKRNDALKVAIITGAGDRAFCSGGDLKAAMSGEMVNFSEAEKFLDAIYEPETTDGLRQFNEHLYPDKCYNEKTKTPGIIRKDE